MIDRQRLASQPNIIKYMPRLLCGLKKGWRGIAPDPRVRRPCLRSQDCQQRVSLLCVFASRTFELQRLEQKLQHKPSSSFFRWGTPPPPSVNVQPRNVLHVINHLREVPHSTGRNSDEAIRGTQLLETKLSTLIVFSKHPWILAGKTHNAWTNTCSQCSAKLCS